MKRKHLITIFCVVVGGSSALAVDYWPRYAAVIQMALYTIMVFGPLLLGLWSERDHRPFWIVMSLAMVVHGVFIYAIRSTFPFSTVLIVIPIALMEAAVLFVTMDRILGGDCIAKRPVARSRP